MSMSNFGKIGCEDIKIFQFFKNGRGPPSLIFKFVKFNWQTVSGRPSLIIVLNVVKIGPFVVETLHFLNFQMAIAAILDF